jgi:hypothetical protein
MRVHWLDKPIVMEAAEFDSFHQHDKIYGKKCTRAYFSAQALSWAQSVYQRAYQMDRGRK